jgi:hypothetical protein
MLAEQSNVQYVRIVYCMQAYESVRVCYFIVKQLEYPLYC